MTKHDDRQRLLHEVVIRHKRGESIRQIKRVTKVSRKTIRKMLDENERRRAQGDDAMVRDGPQPRTPRSSKLDPHIESIDALFKQYPDITAQRVYETLQTDDFDGSYSTVRDYIRKTRPKPQKRAYDPVHTPPGKQAQVDWSPYKIGRDKKLRVEAFSSTLHYSRRKYADFSDNRRQVTLFRHLVESFNVFSGVPAELVFDSEKTVVDRWEMGQPIINLSMLDFAAYYRFKLHIAPRADGAYKGVVERPFRFMETNLFNGRTFNSIAEARTTMAEWLEDKANNRIHPVARRPINDMFAEEQLLFEPLPARPYDTSEIGWRIADGFHRVAFDTNTYTVPRKYVGHRLCVRATQDRVMIYDGYAELLATHERAPHGAHEARELPQHRKRPRIDINKVMERFKTLGEKSEVFANRLRLRQRYVGVELTSILALQAQYRLEDILSAIEQALAYHTYTADAVKRILKVTATELRPSDIFSERIREEIRKTMTQTPVRQRSLDRYQELLTPKAGADANKKETDETDETDEPPDTN